MLHVLDMTFAQNLQKLYSQRDYGINSPAHAHPIWEGIAEVDNPFPLIARTAGIHGQSRDASTYLGTAGFYNFENIIHGQYERAVLFDINSTQVDFWDSTFELIQKSDSADDFRARWNAALGPKHEKEHVQFSGIKLRYAIAMPEVFDEQRYRGYMPMLSTFYDDQSFAFIKDMVAEERIAPVKLDVLDGDACADLGKAIRKTGGYPAAMYISNLANFLGEDTCFYRKGKGGALDGEPSGAGIRIFRENIDLIADGESMQIINNGSGTILENSQLSL